MSNSYRKTPILGITCLSSRASIQKKYRSQENRAKRRKVKVCISLLKYDSIPHEKEYGNEWSSPRDGKQYIGRNCEDKWMRK